MSELRDHPVIENLCRTGYPDGKEPEYPVCPHCGADAEDFYKNRLGQIVGCEHCLTVTKYYEIEMEDDNNAY